MKSHDKDRTDEKLWNYVHITRDKRLGLSDTKIGGDLKVSKNTTLDSLVATRIGIDTSGNDMSGFGQFTDLSTNTLNVFGDTNIYGTLNVDSIFKRTITEVDIDISGNLELFHDLDVSGVITGIGGVDLLGVGVKNKINNVTIGHDVSGMAKFTDLSSNRIDSVNLNSTNIGLDASGYGGFLELKSKTMSLFDNLTIGNGVSDSVLTSRNLSALSLITNSGTNSGEIKINPNENQDIDLIPNGTGKIKLGNGTNKANITTNQTQNLLLDTNSGSLSSLIKIVAGSNGNIQLAPNGTGTILLGQGVNHQTVTTSGSKNLTLNTTNNTVTPAIVLNAGTVGNIDLKHNTTGMVIIGNSSVSGKITTNGQQDLLLSTYSNSSTSSKINIKNDVSGNIQLLTSGTGGKVEIGNGAYAGEITTNSTYDLILTTNNDVSSGFIKINNGENGNIEISPNGGGSVVLGGSINFPSHDGNTGLKLNGILVTADSAELNRLDGSSPGTIANGKVPIYDNNGNLNMKKLILDGVTVGLTATELNLLDGALGGIVVNSKAVIYSDAGKINATQYQLSGTDITSNASELNLVDGSSPASIVNNKAVIYGDSGDINLSVLKLDGTQLYLGSEFSLLDGATVGTVVNSKAVIYSSSGDVIGTKLITGSGGAQGELTSNGSYDLVLKTGNATTGDIKITTGVNGDIVLSPNGSGKVTTTNNITTTGGLNVTNGLTADGTLTLNSLVYPSSDGTSNQILKTDGAGNLSFVSLSLDNIINLKTDTNSIFVGSEPASLSSTNYNSSLGVDTLLNSTTGTNNTAVGYRALYTSSTASSNTAVGSQALTLIESGSNNIGIGMNAGDVLTTGQQNVIIGNNSDPASLASINEIVIGTNVTGHGSNITVIGNSNMVAIHPSADGTVDLGSANYSFKSLFLDGSITMTGSITLNGVDYLSSISNSSITNSNITVGTGKSLDIQNASSFITSNTQNKDIIEGAASDLDIGSYSLTAQTLISDVATGTAPFTVTSTTQVNNLFSTKAQMLESSPSTSIYSTGVENVMSSGDLTISNGMIKYTFTVPAGAIITDIFAVFTTSLTIDAGTASVKMGNTDEGNSYLNSVNLTGSTSRGFNSTGTMGAAAPIGTNYFSTQSNIFVTIFSDGGNLTDGTVKMFLKFVI